jgi:hypothetical protein
LLGVSDVDRRIVPISESPAGNILVYSEAELTYSIFALVVSHEKGRKADLVGVEPADVSRSHESAARRIDFLFTYSLN